MKKTSLINVILLNPLYILEKRSRTPELTARILYEVHQNERHKTPFMAVASVEFRGEGVSFFMSQFFVSKLSSAAF